MWAYVETASVTTVSQLAAIAFQGNFKGGKINVHVTYNYLLSVYKAYRKQENIFFLLSEIFYAEVGLHKNVILGDWLTSPTNETISTNS